MSEPRKYCTNSTPPSSPAQTFQDLDSENEVESVDSPEELTPTELKEVASQSINEIIAALSTIPHDDDAVLAIGKLKGAIKKLNRKPQELPAKTKNPFRRK